MNDFKRVLAGSFLTHGNLFALLLPKGDVMGKKKADGLMAIFFIVGGIIAMIWSAFEKYKVQIFAGLLVCVGLLAIYLIWRRTQLRAWNERRELEDREEWFCQHLAIVQSYVAKVNTAARPETRISNLESAISMLQQMKRNFPEKIDLIDELEKVKNFRRTLHTEIAEESIEKCMDKARTAKTVASRVNQASKALAVIEGSLRQEYVDKDRMHEYQRRIEEFISQVQLDDFEQKAERLAMKGQFSKAADACLDAIFHLKNDAIDDAEQKEQFQRLEERLAQYQVAAEEKEAFKKQRRRRAAKDDDR